MQFHEILLNFHGKYSKNFFREINLFDLMSFYGLDFFKFSGPLSMAFSKKRVYFFPDQTLSKFILCSALQNGFNPIWETLTEFRLLYPELSFIEFQVKTLKEDENSKSSDDPVIGSCIVPYILIQHGYRHVYLEDELGHRLTPACLFLHVSVIDII